MKYVSSIIVFSASLFSAPFAQAEIFRTHAYDSFVVVAENKDELFRFVGNADFSICATGVRFKEELVKLRDGGTSRVYALKALTEETGNSRRCDDEKPKVTASTITEIKTKWRRVKAGNSVTILVPTWISLEQK